MSEVLIVHCIDTEGPLEESRGATFERLYRRGLPLTVTPSAGNLLRIQDGEFGPDLADFVAPRRLQYLVTWDAVTDMLARITSASARAAYPDSLGRPYRFSWFVIDLIGPKNNPRRRAQGQHAVWDNVLPYITHADDARGFHFHVVPPTGDATEYCTSWTATSWHEEALCRRLLERGHFPGIFRAGATIERNDLSHYLERFIPFDYSSRGGVEMPEGDQVDWRGAPRNWGPYHPSWRDYRVPGEMDRTIVRCLDTDSWVTALTESEVEQAFAQAAIGDTTILAYSSHDRRDIGLDIIRVYDLVTRVAARFPGISWRHENALTALQRLRGIAPEQPRLDLSWEAGLLRVTATPTFGNTAEPFLAIKEIGDVVYRDNLSRTSDTTWVYRPPHPKLTLLVAVAVTGPSGEVTTASTACPWPSRG